MRASVQLAICALIGLAASPAALAVPVRSLGGALYGRNPQSIGIASDSSGSGTVGFSPDGQGVGTVGFSPDGQGEGAPSEQNIGPAPTEQNIGV